MSPAVQCGSLLDGLLFQFLTEEDFENIRLRQLSQKLEPSKSRKRKAQEILEEDLVDQVEDEK